MKIAPSLLRKIRTDLGLTQPFVKGQNIPVKDCWHFTTDGNDVDVIFRNDQDFRAGMNRIYVVLQDFDIVILAFCLMDTHVHFILYGDFDACNRFIHEYIRRTSMYISSQYRDWHKLGNVHVNYQIIDNKKVSRRHAIFRISNGECYVRDNQSTNHTFVNGKLLQPGVEIILSNDDYIRLGDEEFRYWVR